MHSVVLACVWSYCCFLRPPREMNELEAVTLRALLPRLLLKWDCCVYVFWGCSTSIVYTMSFLHSHTITLETPLPTSTAKHIQTSIYILILAAVHSKQQQPQKMPRAASTHQRALRPNWKKSTTIKLGEVRAGDGGEDCMKNVQTVDTYILYRY